MFGYRIAGIRHLHRSQFLCREELHLLLIVEHQHIDERLLRLHVDGAVVMGTGQYATVGEGLVDLVVDILVVIRLMSQSEADGSHHRYEVEFEHAVRCRAVERRDDDQQFVFVGIGFADIVDDGDVFGFGGLEIVGTLVACLEQQGCRLTVDEGVDAVLHVVDVGSHGPVESVAEGVECP